VLVVALFVAALAGLAACGGDDDDDTATGPAPTANDPGPNDTSDAPATIQGVTRLDAATSCIVLETDAGPFALQFTDYLLGDDGGAPAIIATSDGRTLAHDGDTVVVTGRASGATDACGTVFTVESLNSVIPAAP
jgi:hypothetical protein